MEIEENNLFLGSYFGLGMSGEYSEEKKDSILTISSTQILVKHPCKKDLGNMC